MQKVVQIKGRNSYLMYGDSEVEDDRFYEVVEESSGSESIHGIALPLLLGDGWKIRMIGSMGDSVITVLSKGEEKDQKEEKSQ